MTDNRSLLCECGNSKAKLDPCCWRCYELERQRYSAKSMREQILAAIERYDMVESIDLRDALGMGQHDADRLSAHLSRLVQDGLIERIGTKYSGYYRAVRNGRRAA